MKYPQGNSKNRAAINGRGCHSNVAPKSNVGALSGVAVAEWCLSEAYPHYLHFLWRVITVCSQSAACRGPFLPQKPVKLRLWKKHSVTPLPSQVPAAVLLLPPPPVHWSRLSLPRCELRRRLGPMKEIKRCSDFIGLDFRFKSLGFCKVLSLWTGCRVVFF